MDRRYRAISSAEDLRCGQMTNKSANSRVIRQIHALGTLSMGRD